MYSTAETFASSKNPFLFDGEEDVIHSFSAEKILQTPLIAARYDKKNKGMQ
eukprot:m.41230 g.41230  ORF g.41230 m.41230 type:complete len:51 (-) comp10407_c1_seq3:3026-3178(-)